ncbi:LysR family transcriptional regulator [Burkholderia sp. BCC1977]|uniref:LysR family transcriptional regulator n=1 Tax=Burkholderia sp. BCC1977 TaxID=2817440 RepID=UPI002ABE4D01|nr:LysR family transcriptional regulator [Burkholderia sp. BCC1977]
MELRHLRHFLAVAAELHMGRAAQRLGMAQPPLSQSIARLEKDVGVPLFIRAHRRLSLTAAGMAFLEEAQASVHHAERAAAFARSASLGEAGVIRIGFDSAALYQHLPQRLLALKAQYPAIQPDLKELSTNDQLKALADGAIDIGFAHPPFITESPIVVHDFPAEISLAVLFDDGTIGDTSLAEIADQGLILFPAEQGPVLHAQILGVFAAAGLEARIVAEANRALTMLSLVSAKLGATILPASTKRLHFTGVRFASICDATMPTWPLSMVTRRERTSRLVRKVWQLFRDVPTK